MNKTATIAVLGACLALLASTAEAGHSRCKTRWRPCPVTGTNAAPTISGVPQDSVAVGAPYSFTPAARDADGDRLTFLIANRPPWARFSSSTGRLDGTPDAGALGEHSDIRIGVSDGRQSSWLPAFSVTVWQANRAPTISGTPPATAREGQHYSFTPAAHDADGDRLAFDIVNRPGWASFDPSTGALTGTPGAGTARTYSGIIITASDGAATASLPAFSLTVQQTVLGVATLSWLAPTTRTDGSPLTNLAGYRIRYGTSPGSLTNVLDVPNGGLTRVVVSELAPATWTFVVRAYDATGAESADSTPVTKTIP